MRRRTKAALVATALLIAGIAAGIPLYVTPHSDDPDTVDVDIAYVIGPPTDARMAVAHDMLDDGRADVLMISLDPEENADWPEAARACAGEGPAATTTVLCHKPDPFTTRGEARWLEDEMAQNGWDSAAVITLTPHITRTRMIMERCETGDVSVVDVGESLDPWFWAYMYAYQTAGFAKAAVLQGC